MLSFTELVTPIYQETQHPQRAAIKRMKDQLATRIKHSMSYTMDTWTPDLIYLYESPSLHIEMLPDGFTKMNPNQPPCRMKNQCQGHFIAWYAPSFFHLHLGFAINPGKHYPDSSPPRVKRIAIYALLVFTWRSRQNMWMDRRFNYLQIYLHLNSLSIFNQRLALLLKSSPCLHCRNIAHHNNIIRLLAHYTLLRPKTPYYISYILMSTNWK
jgi:hypothetical protein